MKRQMVRLKQHMKTKQLGKLLGHLQKKSGFYTQMRSGLYIQMKTEWEEGVTRNFRLLEQVNIRSVDEVVIIGATLSLSSSAFVLQLLADKGELPTRILLLSLCLVILLVIESQEMSLITIEGDEARQVSIDVLHLVSLVVAFIVRVSMPLVEDRSSMGACIRRKTTCLFVSFLLSLTPPLSPSSLLPHPSHPYHSLIAVLANWLSSTSACSVTEYHVVYVSISVCFSCISLQLHCQCLFFG
ncbi:hypothetical protein V2J09_008905 [Rumex salicifolius]